MPSFISAILLINLGTPFSSSPKDVKRYLTEFLTDSRVIQLPWLLRQLLVRLVIVPFRAKSSSCAYRSIWMKEGSPLLVHGEALAQKLQKKMSGKADIYFAMRYQQPSLEKVLQEIESRRYQQLIIIPLFPQYASATVGSIYEKVFSLIKNWDYFPEIVFKNLFYYHPLFIEAFCKNIREQKPQNYDHIIFSFHGLPEKHIHNLQIRGCLQEKCCDTIQSSNQACYRAQCWATAQKIAKDLSLTQNQYTVSFQSRLGKEPWIGPDTHDIIEKLAKEGKKELLVAAPSFVADCIETLEEIGMRYQEAFVALGGKNLTLVPSLNDSSIWVDAIDDLVDPYLIF